MLFFLRSGGDSATNHFDLRMALCYCELGADQESIQVFDHMIRQVNVPWPRHPSSDRFSVWVKIGFPKSMDVFEWFAIVKKYVRPARYQFDTVTNPGPRFWGPREEIHYSTIGSPGRFFMWVKMLQL